MAAAPRQPLLSPIPEEGVAREDSPQDAIEEGGRCVCEPRATAAVVLMTIAGIGLVGYLLYIMWVAVNA